MKSFSAIWFLLVLSSNSFANSNEDKAINYLLQNISKTKVYDSWIKPNCLIVKKEAVTTQYYDLAIRENHTGDCSGDPGTKPIIDRFRVYSTNEILWYDISNNKFLSFKQFVNLRKAN